MGEAQLYFPLFILHLVSCEKNMKIICILKKNKKSIYSRIPPSNKIKDIDYSLFVNFMKFKLYH